jgi:hypothetical protein
MTPKERSQNFVARRRAAGLCLRCPSPAEPGGYRCSSHKREHKTQEVNTARIVRVEAIVRYGGACSSCGIHAAQFLTLDHIDGGGYKHRKTENFADLARYLKRHHWPDGYQVLCWNHNFKNHRQTLTNEQTSSCPRIWRFRQRLRLAAFTAYSSGAPSCACCGETDTDVLTIDHVHGGGKQHRLKQKAHNLAQWLKVNHYPPGYQILCFNCNAGRAINGGTCPHLN